MRGRNGRVERRHAPELDVKAAYDGSHISYCERSGVRHVHCVSFYTGDDLDSLGDDDSYDEDFDTKTIRVIRRKGSIKGRRLG